MFAQSVVGGPSKMLPANPASAIGAARRILIAENVGHYSTAGETPAYPATMLKKFQRVRMTYLVTDAEIDRVKKKMHGENADGSVPSHGCGAAEYASCPYAAFGVPAADCDSLKTITKMWCPGRELNPFGAFL